VFNVAQCDGIRSNLIPEVKRDNKPIEICERIVDQMPNKPTMQYMENEAYYIPSEDILNMPDIEYFIESEAYYATLFHELLHNAANKIMPHGIARGLVSRAFPVRVYGIIFDLF
jgi:antirestriction protein ArdC